MGELDVLPMEVSTSSSRAASVPATISTRMGAAATYCEVIVRSPS
jgi:hypothetical protein